MALKLSLVVEKPDVNDEFEYIEEEVDRNSPANLYIKGPYMMAEDINRNNRLYPLDELESNSDAYYALLNLGFKSNKIRETIKKITSKNQNISTEGLIKKSLKEL